MTNRQDGEKLKKLGGYQKSCNQQPLHAPSPKNKLYVAMTRVRYSLGFIIPDEFANKCGLSVWEDDH